MATPVDRSETFTGAGSRSIQLSGRFIRVLAADVSGVTITPHPGSPLLRFTGQDVDAGATFQWFDIAVTVACTVKICVSGERQSDTNTNINANVSAVIGPGGTVAQPGDVACANAVATQIIAGDANALTVLVRSSNANNYPDGTVRIGTTGVTAASGIELNVGDTIPVDTTVPVVAFNNSGAAVTLQLLKVGK